MFEPTIKYKRVNEPAQKITKQLENLTILSKQPQPDLTSSTPCKNEVQEINEKSKEVTAKEKESEPQTNPDEANNKEKPESTTEATKEDILASYSFEEEEEDSTIEVDPNDEDRVIITLSTGKKYGADRYCPHAGVDLSAMGKVSEHDYPPEVGPVLMCTYHYWEFALDKGGKGAYNSSLNACPIEDGEPCPVISEKKELEW